MAIDITDILTEFEEYKTTGNMQKDLFTHIMQPSVTERYFPKYMSDKQVVESALADFTKPLQRFQTAWTPKGGVTFTPSRVVASRVKIDDEFYPDVVVGTWLADLANTAELDRKQWPFVKWYIKNVQAKANEQWELDEIFKGELGSITPGTATATGTNHNGLRKQIVDGITATTVNVVSAGAFPTTASGAVDYIEAFVDGIPELQRTQIDYVFVSPELARMYQRGFDAEYNTNYLREGELYSIRYNNLKVVGLPSMIGSQVVFATPAFNRFSFIYHEKNTIDMRVENVDRLVKTYTDYHRAAGFRFMELIYTNGETDAASS